jgi:hypothetical protein
MVCASRTVQLALLVLAGLSFVAGELLAGAAKVDCSLPVGVPLAGINHGGRRVKDFPIPKPTKYTTWMTPSTGLMLDGIWWYLPSRAMPVPLLPVSRNRSPQAPRSVR